MKESLASKLVDKIVLTKGKTIESETIDPGTEDDLQDTHNPRTGEEPLDRQDGTELDGLNRDEAREDIEGSGDESGSFPGEPSPSLTEDKLSAKGGGVHQSFHLNKKAVFMEERHAQSIISSYIVFHTNIGKD